MRALGDRAHDILPWGPRELRWGWQKHVRGALRSAFSELPQERSPWSPHASVPPAREDSQTEFLWLLSLLGSTFTPLDFSSIAFFTARHETKASVGTNRRASPVLSAQRLRSGKRTHSRRWGRKANRGQGLQARHTAGPDPVTAVTLVLSPICAQTDCPRAMRNPTHQRHCARVCGRAGTGVSYMSCRHGKVWMKMEAVYLSPHVLI